MSTKHHETPAAASRGFLIGADFGKVTTSLAWAEVGPDGRLAAVATRASRHLGEPLAPLLELYRELGHERIAGLAATGAFGDRLQAPVAAGLPDEVAQEQAVRALYPDGEALNVVRIGGSGYSVLTRDATGLFGFEANERCSAGTGETIEGLCSRLGCSLDEAIALAGEADESVAVTSRCAVFAKSELTHFANQGVPHGRLFRGVFDGVARNVHSLYDKQKVPGRVLAVGHGALIAPVVETFTRLAGVPVEAPDEAGVFEAIGALEFARRQAWEGVAWPADPAALVKPPEHRVRALAPAADGPGSVVRLEDGNGSAATTGWGSPEQDARSTPTPSSPVPTTAVLGLDLGSTGSKAALLDLTTGELLADVYRRTDGNPVQAAQALIAELREMSDAAVVGVGITGSGRDAAATVFRAAYPDDEDRLTVQNEIVAHATAAMRLDPDAGRSLSIVEIGGQDAKFINVKGGHIVESDMNRVCSAGTGSFLEEQALANGLDDIALFGELAARSTRPPDLGQTCTVFVADVAAEALADGYTRDDIFAGLQYSVIRNYKGRVMGERPFLDRVFFQGKPATSASLARTLAAVTGREVYVPPNPGAMGAIGIAQLAAVEIAKGNGNGGGAGDARAAARPGTGREPLDLARFLDARIAGTKEQRCGDRDCRNLCRLEVATVTVGDETRRIVSGGNCPKYDTVSAAGKLPKDAPDPYREREELLAGLIESPAGAAVGVTPVGLSVGLPWVHYLIDELPFFHALLTGLGFEVEVLRAGRDTLADGDRRCSAAGSCAPVKLLHGLTGEGLDALFLPVFVNTSYANGGAGRYTCPMTQGAPGMLERALVAEGSPTRIVAPVLMPDAKDQLDSDETREALRAALDEFIADANGGGGGGRGVLRRARPRLDAAAFARAYDDALERRRRFADGRLEIGARALVWARERDLPVVLIAGETHVIHEPELDSGIHELVAGNGAVPIPVDCFPVPDEVPPLLRVHWAAAGAALRAAVAAARAGDVFPLLLGAYGCGPNSFVEHCFNDLFEDYPHAVLETDGHGGKAGYVTRVQAFLHSVRGSLAERAEIETAVDADGSGSADDAAGSASDAGNADDSGSFAGRLARYDRPLPHSLDAGGYDRYVFGHVGGGLGRQVAAAMRGRGLAADYAGEADGAALAAAQGVCSGKECLPYQLIWGSMARYFERHPPADGDGKTLFLSIGNGFQACRANLFPLAEEVALDRLGLAGRVDVGDFSLVTGNTKMMPVVWAAVVAVDLLNMMRFYHLATEADRGAADALFDAYSDELEGLLEEPRLGEGMREALAEGWRTVGRVEELIDRAASEFRQLPQRDVDGDLRDVFLNGDIYLRVDEWGNDDLHRKLADLGLRTIFEPFGELFELIVLRTIQDAGLTSRRGLSWTAMLRAMRYIVVRLTHAARLHQPWVFWQDVHEVEAESRRLAGAYPFGETISTVGSALLAWRTKPVDGVVSVAPRGCGPALIAEAQLRREAGLPILFVYNDGDPIDAARLAGFAWRLRSREARRPDQSYLPV